MALSRELARLRAALDDWIDEVIAAVVIACFAALTLLQLVPAPEGSRWFRAAYVHVNNGLYANAVFSRLTGAFRRDTAR